ncbi:chemotaxis-specific protein-glutamate methyltransferase CheB [Halomonas alkaliantarctica]|nr:chemotaxis-specific protein-glutamate methyltransferase CheB [Halomonas alkaliantarctica]
MNPTKRYRVLVVDDSATARALLRELLEQGGMAVVAEARNGEEAVELVREHRPDLVTMDLHMPVMSGLQAIEAIMHEKAVPILVVSSETDAEMACEALDMGALEVMTKPDLTPSQAAQFVRKARLLAGVPVITRIKRRIMTNNVATPPLVASKAPVEGSPHPRSAPGDAKARPYQHVFALASSTGGPQALARLLPRLEATFPAPILLAQHMCDGFVEGMAQWLSGMCHVNVKVAEEGEPLKAGHVYISPSETHLTVTPYHRVALQARTATDIYRPSCDHLLASVAEVYGKEAIGVILTGMGRDGAAGMQKIHAKGGVGLAQDEASSLIYGMNQEAVKLGGVHRELPLEKLADEMQRILALTPSGYLHHLKAGLNA